MRRCELSCSSLVACAAAQGIIVPSGMPIRLHQVASGLRWEPAHCPSLLASDAFQRLAPALLCGARCLRGAAHLSAACAQFYAGLKVAPDGSLTLEDHIAESQPFQTFAESKARERERELQVRL